MSVSPRAGEAIREAVASWNGVSIGPHRFGGMEFRLGKRELGHLHGDVLLDIPFPRKVRDALIASSEARPHHILPHSGWVSFPIHQPDDVGRAIALLRRSYDIASSRAH